MLGPVYPSELFPASARVSLIHPLKKNNKQPTKQKPPYSPVVGIRSVQSFPQGFPCPSECCSISGCSSAGFREFLWSALESFAVFRRDGSAHSAWSLNVPSCCRGIGHMRERQGCSCCPSLQTEIPGEDPSQSRPALPSLSSGWERSHEQKGFCQAGCSTWSLFWLMNNLIFLLNNRCT